MSDICTNRELTEYGLRTVGVFGVACIHSLAGTDWAVGGGGAVGLRAREATGASPLDKVGMNEARTWNRK